MGNIIFFIVLNLFYVTTKASNPRAVNVALQTSLLFKPGEENGFSLINKIRSFIDQLEQAISPVKAFLRTTDDKNRSKIFSKFIEEITRNIIKYNDEHLKEVAKLLANEAEKVLDTKEVFNENAKNAILNILKEYSRFNPKQIRTNLEYALNGNEIIVNRLADKIDVFYDGTDKAKLDELIDKSEKFAEQKSGNAKTDIQDMVKDFINILKDKYKTLDETAKIQINRDLGNIFQYIDLNKIHSNYDNKKRAFKKKLSKKYKDVTKNGNFKNPKEIIVNKDVEILVRSLKNTKNGTAKVNEKMNSKENDLDNNKPDNHSVDLSTVLDELNKSK